MEEFPHVYKSESYHHSQTLVTISHSEHNTLDTFHQPITNHLFQTIYRRLHLIWAQLLQNQQ